MPAEANTGGTAPPEGYDQVVARESVRSPRRPQETPLGDALTSAQASILTRERRCTLALLAGGEGSGKTTFITCVYDLLSEGPLGAWDFAGSYTLRGFEQRTNGGRIEGGLEAADTERTSPKAPPWLHLGLRRRDGPRERVDLLFGDLSGEWFDRLTEGKIGVADLPYLQRVDHLSVVLDGNRLVGSEGESEVLRAIRLVRLILDTPSLDPRAVDVVITKWDLIARAGATAIAVADDAYARVVNVVDTVGGVTPRLFRTAARSEWSNLPTGHGVPDAVDSWLGNPALPQAHPVARVDGLTALDRYVRWRNT